MIALFDFDLPLAVTEQLMERLDQISSSQLTREALNRIAVFQREHGLIQGVYLLLLGNEPMYAGKAVDVRERLEQHWNKLRGRKNLKIKDIRFKAFLLHGNWATSANEGLLIAMYRKQGKCIWNGAGFGPKDVGRPRDGTKPNKFDTQYPINENWPIADLRNRQRVRDVLEKVKRQLPFVFRYEVAADLRDKVVDLRGIARTAKDVITAAGRTLGREFQVTLLKSHIILYKESVNYPYGERLWP